MAESIESIESSVRKRIRKSKIQKAILTTLVLSGAVAIGVTAPNALGVFTQMADRYRRRYMRNAVGRLIDRGYIRIQEDRGKRFLEITELGRVFLHGSRAFRKPKRWDRKWRLVIFDIAQTRAHKRKLLRDKIQELGFMKLQNSVWIFPYDCEDLILLLKSDFELGKEVLYIVADEIEMAGRLKKHFGLRD